MADSDLTSVARVKDFLKLTSDVDDGLLQALVTRYSEWVQVTRLNRRIAAADYEKRLNGWGGDRWVAPQYPIISVAGVTIGGGAALIADTDYWFDDTAIYLIGGSFPRGPSGNVVISWRAGYEIIPEDLDQTVAELVAFIYRSRDNFTTVTKSIAGENITFIMKTAPERLLESLNSWRKVFPG